MGERFANLRKIPKEPARRFLALSNARLSVKLTSPAAAPVETVLAELDGVSARSDMIRLLAAALPARECIWWGCLAAGDLVSEDAPLPPPLAAARAWVFKPTDETREAARLAAETADPDDETTLCGNAVAMHDGRLGTGEMAAHRAPAGAVGTFVFALNVMSLSRATPDTLAERYDMLIDRALDIARGGNGRHGAGAAQGIAP